MIDKALLFVTDFLNRNLKMSYGLTEDIVVAASLINLDGSVTDNIENKVVVSIINLEHETKVKYGGGYIPDQGGDLHKVNPPVYPQCISFGFSKLQFKKLSGSCKNALCGSGDFSIPIPFLHLKAIRT